MDFHIHDQGWEGSQCMTHPCFLKKPSPELPFKKIGQNTHVIHSISLGIPTGWLKNQAQSSYASEWVWFFTLDHVSLKAT